MRPSWPRPRTRSRATPKAFRERLRASEKSPIKDAALNADYVVLFIGGKIPTTPTDIIATRVGSYSLLWVHLSDLSRSPVEFFFHAMHVCPESLPLGLRIVGGEPKLAAHHGGVLTLVSNNKSYPPREASRLIDPTEPWSVVLFEIVDSVELLGDIVPNKFVARLPASRIQQVWGPAAIKESPCKGMAEEWAAHALGEPESGPPAGGSVDGEGLPGDGMAGEEFFEADGVDDLLFFEEEYGSGESEEEGDATPVVVAPHKRSAAVCELTIPGLGAIKLYKDGRFYAYCACKAHLEDVVPDEHGEPVVRIVKCRKI